LFEAVQKMDRAPKTAETGARRGRPRGYDPDAALAKARDAFWEAGFASTSLDDLSEATGMNRPSLYAAFGDKHALYGNVLDAYREAGLAAMEEALDPSRPLREGLRDVYAKALSMYFPSGKPPRGCLMIGTAVTEAVNDPQIRASLSDGFRAFDKAFAARLRQARDAGELPAESDSAMLGKLASAFLYFLAIPSRSGESRKSLEAFADAAVALICGA
jgi:TetR/AcrR family transcriptional regulator, copper-responsive repressor